MRTIQKAIWFVGILGSAVSWFGLPEAWKAMIEYIEELNKFVHDNAEYPFLFFAFFGLLIGGGVLPSALNAAANRLLFKKAADDFDAEFSLLEEERATLRLLVQNVYEKWRADKHPEGVSQFLKRFKTPETLPLDRSGSILEWSQTIPPKFNADYQELWDFVARLIFEGNYVDKYRRPVAKFWDRWGHEVMIGNLRPSDIENSLKANVLDLLLLTYWEPAKAGETGWDEGPGKSGLFHIASEAERLL